MTDELDILPPGQLTLDELKHYGILGMKWGVRRDRGPDGRIIKNKKAKTPPSEDYNRAQALAKKGRKGLSNAELREVNQRAQLERTFKDLHPNPYEKGQRFASKLLSVGGIGVSAYALYRSPAYKPLIRLGKKFILRR